MKKFLLIAGVFVAVAFAIAFLIVASIVGKGCTTASKMADQTIFNADKNVWTYEQFYAKYESYKQHKAMYESTKEQIDKLREKNVSSDDDELQNLIMQKTGSFQMMANIAAEYNKMASVAYQKIWQSKSLPETLEAPKP